MTFATAALMPTWASDVTSFTPRKPRRVSFRGKPVQKVSASDAPTSRPALPGVRAVDANREDNGGGCDAILLPHFHIGRVDPDIGPFALDAPLQESILAFVDLLAEPGHLALGHARRAHGFDQIIDGTGCDALDISSRASYPRRTPF